MPNSHVPCTAASWDSTKFIHTARKLLQKGGAKLTTSANAIHCPITSANICNLLKLGVLSPPCSFCVPNTSRASEVSSVQVSHVCAMIETRFRSILIFLIVGDHKKGIAQMKIIKTRMLWRSIIRKEPVKREWKPLIRLRPSWLENVVVRARGEINSGFELILQDTGS